MVTLAEALRKAELRKNDLDLELQLLEEAAELVIEEEQEEQIKKGKQDDGGEQTKECEEEDESSSSSSSSEEEEDRDSSVSESEEEEEEGVSAVTCPCSQGTEHGASLIQELGERLEEELRIREDVPQITVPFSSTAREEVGEVEGVRKTDDSQLPGALDGVKITNAASDTARFRHRQGNIRILNTEELDSDDEDELNQ